MSDSSVSAILGEVVNEVPGWSPHDQLHALFSLAYGSSHLQGDLFELGSWCGRSAIALGLAARLSASRVHCVDLFPVRSDWSQNVDGSYSLRVNLPQGSVDAYQVQTVWKEPFEQDIEPVYLRYGGTLEAFGASVSRFGVRESVSEYRGTSELLTSEPGLNRRFRLAFIDGDHGYDAVCHDIDLITSRLVSGGFICFDDAFTSYEGVDQAIRDRILNADTYEAGIQMTRKMFVARKR